MTRSTTTPETTPKRTARKPPRGHDFPSEIDLEAIATVNLNNRPVSMLVLSNRGNRDNLQFVFGWETPGIHSEMDETAAETVLTQLTDGVNALPKAERLAVHYAFYSDDSARQRELDALLAGPVGDPVLRGELWSAKARVQALTRAGNRQQVEINLFATWTSDTADAAGQSPLEKVLQPVARLVEQLQPDGGSADARRLQEQLRQASAGQAAWHNILSSRMGLTVEPLDAADLWQVACNHLQRRPAGPIPQHLILDETGLHEHVTSDRHPGFMLTRAALPEPGEDCVTLNDQQVGVITMMEKPNGWGGNRDQARFLLTALKRAASHDTDIIVEFTAADRHLQRTALQFLNRQANTTAARAAGQNVTDVQAEYNAEQAVDARLDLIKGASPVYVGFAVLVRRPSRPALDDACRKLIDAFPGTAWVEREHHVAWQTWLQTLPVTRQPLQKYPLFDQRTLFFSHEAVGFMPLARPRPHARQGLELLAEDGGIPLHLDFYR